MIEVLFFACCLLPLFPLKKLMLSQYMVCLMGIRDPHESMKLQLNSLWETPFHRTSTQPAFIWFLCDYIPTFGSTFLTSSISLIDNSVGKFLPLTSDGGCPVYILVHTIAGLVGGGQKVWLVRWCLEPSQPHRTEGLASQMVFEPSQPHRTEGLAS